MKLTFQRQSLYEEVWSSPKKKLTKKFGITYYHLTKICDELNIPTPPLGYWKKLKHNKKVKKVPLPKEGPDSYTLKKEDLISSDIHGLLPEKMKPITVKKHLRNPHPIVRATHNQLKEREVDRYKRLEPIREGFLDVSVSQDNLKRALRIMDAIIRELERQKIDIGTEYNYKRSNLYVSIGKVKLYLRIREKCYRVTNPPDESGGYSWKHPKFEYFPDGKLRLEISTFHSGEPNQLIQDTKKQTLENQIDSFFPLLFHVAKKRKKHLDKMEAGHQERERRHKLYVEADKQVAAERGRLHTLEESAESFTKSQYIYEFISEIEKQQSELDLMEEEQFKLKAWIIWARNHADWLNPINRTLKSILKS
jgi:hypothetical protein